MMSYQQRKSTTAQKHGLVARHLYTSVVKRVDGVATRSHIQRAGLIPNASRPSVVSVIAVVLHGLESEKGYNAMGTILAVFAGALYSAAYVAPRPYYFLCLILSAVLVILMRSF